MLGPLKANVEVAELLIRQGLNPDCKEMAQTILISSKLIMLNVNDLLDHKFILNGHFSPKFTQGSIY